MEIRQLFFEKTLQIKFMKFPYKTNICYIINNKNEVLLRKKARGFGAGKWNGPGGKIDPGETPEESTIREVKEETGLVVKNLKKRGAIEFVFTENNDLNNYTHIFVCRDYAGEPRDLGEGKLKWYNIEEIPLDKMWDDDKYWLPEVLIGGKVSKRFYFDKNGLVIKHEDI